MRDAGPLSFPKVAEAQRFELWLGRNPTIGFQDRPLQPLGYASVYWWSIGGLNTGPSAYKALALTG